MRVAEKFKHPVPSPQIEVLLSKTTARLIDRGLLSYEASIAGFAERYGRGESSHTIHVWWARRPHSAMRALVFASLCKDASDTALELISKLGATTVAEKQILEQARITLKTQYKRSPPRVLDMFGGGGTIPFEAANLGAEVYSIDANELSVFIQRCNLLYSQGIQEPDISSIVEMAGRRVLNQLANATSSLFTLRATDLYGNPIKTGISTYFWTYSTICPSCGRNYFLSKRPWLSKKHGRNLGLLADTDKLRITAIPPTYEYESVWKGKNGTAVCPYCRSEKTNINITTCQDELVATARPANGKGKEFLVPVDNAIPSKSYLRTKERKLLDDLKTELPQSRLPKWSGIVNPALYGIETHADFLNSRQRIVLLELIRALREEHKLLSKTYSPATSKYVISLLSSFIDQLVDWNCRLSMWIPQNEQVGRAFCGPGVSMLWDYAETDPVALGPSNLWAKLNRIVEAVSSVGKFPHKPQILHAHAQDLPFADNYFEAIVTDPPYYDNIYYSVLADFFFAWKRILLKMIEPELFDPSTTAFNRELVASTHRYGTPASAHQAYCEQLIRAIGEAERVLKPQGVFAFIYAHSSLNGWEALVRAYRPAKLSITSVQPLSIERRQRPRAMYSEAVNICIAFIARKNRHPKGTGDLKLLLCELRKICQGKFASELRQFGWSESDTAIAVYAQGVAMLANVESLANGESICESLIEFEGIVKERFPSFTVAKRHSI